MVLFLKPGYAGSTPTFPAFQNMRSVSIPKARGLNIDAQICEKDHDLNQRVSDPVHSFIGLRRCFETPDDPRPIEAWLACHPQFSSSGCRLKDLLPSLPTADRSSRPKRKKSRSWERLNGLSAVCMEYYYASGILPHSSYCKGFSIARAGWVLPVEKIRFRL